ncbi:bifunctional 3-demethylubiquinone-9 3-methyltransferase/ 2-octaprenyl-6-hydroxy phenol methylase [bacterium BMS3Abin14]|nr:bifunctional 3-demethylubiquinone-9 3-methyltransferase/ 2-octaprenyl-6-hydroxy phenol methylase [bacterium BMS3Abin14]
MNDEFDAKAYWEKRLMGKYDLSGVGWESLGRPYNRWIYWAKKKIFRRLAGPLCDSSSELSVLDIGSGTGFYIERWKELGVPAISGCDITAIAVEKLRERFPEIQFEQLDIAGDIAKCGIASTKYDIVSSFDVLYHIVDDDSFERAVSNISNLMKPEGLFFLTDYFFRFRGFRSEHVVGRTLKDYKAVIEKNGFEILERRPASILCFPPSDVKSRLSPTLWYIATFPMRIVPALGYIYGLLFAPVDVLLTKILKEGPGLEFMVCKKRA